MINRFQTIIRQLPVIVVFLVSIFYCTIVIGKFAKDTTSIFNVAFGITAALSGLCFGMASSIEEGKYKIRIAYCGERFFHASISFLIRSILKYSALKVDGLEWIGSVEWIQTVILFIFHGLSLPLFAWAVYDTHAAVSISNKILWERLYKDKDWDSIS